MGKDRPDDDREYPAGAGVSPYRTGFGAIVTGLLALGSSSMVFLRSPAGFGKTDGFFDKPLVPLEEGAAMAAFEVRRTLSGSLAGDCRLS